MQIDQTYPAAAVVVESLRSSLLLADSIDWQIRAHGDAFWKEAERLVGLARTLGGAPCESILEYTLATLREQANFLKSGEYAYTDFETARREIYDNPDVMERFYLEGLMLTHAFWPIHYDMHRFFRQEFLPRVPSQGRGMEIGYGHGLYLADVLQAQPDTSAIGLDISECSQSYASRLLEATGIDSHRFDLRLWDVRDGIPLQDASCDWIVFAEVLEHIPDPEAALAEVRRCLAPGAPVFINTVVDGNAIDHLFRFESVDEIRDVLQRVGLQTELEKLFRVTDYNRDSRDPTIDPAFVCFAPSC